MLFKQIIAGDILVSEAVADINYFSGWYVNTEYIFH